MRLRPFGSSVTYLLICSCAVRLLLWERDRQIANMKAHIAFLEQDRNKMDAHSRHECDKLCYEINELTQLQPALLIFKKLTKGSHAYASQPCRMARMPAIQRGKSSAGPALASTLTRHSPTGAERRSSEGELGRLERKQSLWAATRFEMCAATVALSHSS